MGLDEPGAARCLRVLTGPLAGSVYAIDEQLEIGRSSTAAVQLVEPGVSRAHAIVLRDVDAITVVDLMSTNGTWVGGRRIERAELELGDTFRIADSEFQLDTYEDPLQIGSPTLDMIVDGRSYRPTARIGFARELGTDVLAKALNAPEGDSAEAPSAELRRVTSLLSDIVVFRTLHVRHTRGEIDDDDVRRRYDALSESFLRDHDAGTSTFIRFDVELDGRLEFEDARGERHDVDITEIGVDGARIASPPRVVDDYSLCWLSVPIVSSLGPRSIVFTARVLSSKAETLDVLFSGAPKWTNRRRRGEVSTDFFAKTIPLTDDDA